MRQQDLYARLELIAPQVPPNKPSRFGPVGRSWGLLKARMAGVGHGLLHYFCGSMEPRILVRQNGHGISHYRIYDPFTQQHHTFGSETELRAWLDRRYNQ